MEVLITLRGAKEINCRNLATKVCGNMSHIMSEALFLQFKKVVKQEETFKANKNGSDNKKRPHSKFAKKWLAEFELGSRNIDRRFKKTMIGDRSSPVRDTVEHGNNV